jgi:hypothetical protein
LRHHLVIGHARYSRVRAVSSERRARSQPIAIEPVTIWHGLDFDATMHGCVGAKLSLFVDKSSLHHI